MEETLMIKSMTGEVITTITIDNSAKYPDMVINKSKEVIDRIEMSPQIVFSVDKGSGDIKIDDIVLSGAVRAAFLEFFKQHC